MVPALRAVYLPGAIMQGTQHLPGTLGPLGPEGAGTFPTSSLRPPPYCPSFKGAPIMVPASFSTLSDCELRLGKSASSVLSLSPGKHMKNDRYCEFSPCSHCEGNTKRLELQGVCPPKV